MRENLSQTPAAVCPVADHQNSAVAGPPDPILKQQTPCIKW
jgi:hypothetical protein